MDRSDIGAFISANSRGAFVRVIDGEATVEKGVLQPDLQAPVGWARRRFDRIRIPGAIRSRPSEERTMPEAAIATPRVLALEGGHNFREVGGYPTTSGGRLRRGLVWRSAGLDRLSSADCEAIRALGIHTIADLRTEHERQRFPTAAGVAETVRTLAWSRDGAGPSSPTEGRPAWWDLDTVAIRGEIARLYTHIAEAHAPQFAAVYQAMAEGALPILIHCAAGKDRTGLAVAILLELIGVERDWVIWDYAQTGAHLKPHMINLESAAGVGAMADWLASLGPEGRKLLMAADEAYLLAALADIEARFGSIRAFAREKLALPDATIDALAGRLVET